MLKNMRRADQMADAAEQAAVLFAQEALRKLEGDDLLTALLAEAKKVIGLREFSQECARDAASYMHPRLAAIAHTDDKRSQLFKRIESVIVDPANTSCAGLSTAS